MSSIKIKNVCLVSLAILFLFNLSALAKSELLNNEMSLNYEFDQELEVFKWITLESYPNIQVPVFRSSGTQGPSILFVHGNSSSSKAFHRQMFSKFGKKHQLFFMDLPGHGLASKVSADKVMPMLEDNSNPAGFPEYQDGINEAISLVANDPDVKAEIIVGWSLGGHAAIKTYGLGLIPNVKGIFVYGTAPAIRNHSPLGSLPFKFHTLFNKFIELPLLPSLGLSLQIALNKNGFNLNAKFTDRLPFNTPYLYRNYPNRGSAYMRAFFSPSNSIADIPKFMIIDGFERSDDRFRTSLAIRGLELDTSYNGINELESLLKIGHDKVLLGVGLGEMDEFINPDYLSELKLRGFLPTLWKDKIQVFMNSGHAVQLEQPENFNDLLISFIESVEELEK